jgi:hypothetical protein
MDMTAKQLRALAKRLREALPDRTVQVYWDDMQLSAAAVETLANRLDDSKMLARIKAAAHHLLNRTTNPPRVEARLRRLLYGG